jgi:hypothetical protein
MRCPRRGVGPESPAGRDTHREGADNEARSDHEVRAASGPDQERSGEHVPNQAHARDVTVRAELVLKVEQLNAIPIANPSRI